MTATAWAPLATEPLPAGAFWLSLRVECGRRWRHRFLLDSERWMNDPKAAQFATAPNGGAVSVLHKWMACSRDVRPQRPAAGRRIVEARARGATGQAIVVATHGLFAGPAPQRLAEARIGMLFTTDTVAPPARPVSHRVVAPLLADMIVRLHDR